MKKFFYFFLFSFCAITLTVAQTQVNEVAKVVFSNGIRQCYSDLIKPETKCFYPIEELEVVYQIKTDSFTLSIDVVEGEADEAWGYEYDLEQEVLTRIKDIGIKNIKDSKSLSDQFFAIIGSIDIDSLKMLCISQNIADSLIWERYEAFQDTILQIINLEEKRDLYTQKELDELYDDYVDVYYSHNYNNNEDEYLGNVLKKIRIITQERIEEKEVEPAIKNYEQKYDQLKRLSGEIRALGIALPRKVESALIFKAGYLYYNDKDQITRLDTAIGEAKALLNTKK